MPADTGGRGGHPTARSLTGWGRTSPSTAAVLVVDDVDDIVKAAGAAPGRGVIARGLGRSYNDAAQNGGGVVLDLTANDRLLDVDEASASIRVGSGASIDRLLHDLVPRGLFPPVTPGTRFVTVGGAIAADVHGKNHHRDGTFARFVSSLRLWTPADGLSEITPDTHPDVFWATAGGMGLTGLIVDATVRMRRIETSRMVVDTDRADELDVVLQLMSEGDDEYLYSVAWIDCQATGRHLGRSVLTRGRHATVDELPHRDRSQPLALASKIPVAAPPWMPSGLVNRATVALFSEFWFRKAPRRERGRVEPFDSFFYPLDRVGGWNRVYGRRGFIQYQFVVPLDRVDALGSVLELLASSHTASPVTVLKRFGPGTPGHLSFPMPGWTLAVDVPVGPPGLAQLLDTLDRIVVDAGGRCYLAKDGRLHPDVVPEMYPRLEEWRAVQRRLDPDGVLESDLARRLDLLGRGRRS